MFCRFAALLLGLLPAIFAAQTVDEILAHNFAARGGLQKIKAIQSQRLTGHISFGPKAEGPLLVQMARPSKMRQQVTMDGKPLTLILNGDTGWALIGGEVKPLPPGQIKNMQGGADFEGPLVDYQARGITVELQGSAKVEGRDAWKLRVTQKNGDVRMDYIDAATWLETKWEGQIQNQNKKLDVESFFRDYRDVDGLQYAFRIESNTVECRLSS